MELFVGILEKDIKSNKSVREIKLELAQKGFCVAPRVKNSMTRFPRLISLDIQSTGFKNGDHRAPIYCYAIHS